MPRSKSRSPVNRSQDKKLYKLYKSASSTKKYDVYVINPKTGRVKKVSFGAKGYEDYTTHHDKERRERYRTRHAKDKINDITSPGFWSWHILWGNSTSIQRNMSSIKKYK